MIEECFAYKKGECLALKVPVCKGEKCSFYKTKEKAEEDRKKAIDRIKTLDVITQRRIIDNYYGGKVNHIEKVEVDI
jgi:hypothetical protein